MTANAPPLPRSAPPTPHLHTFTSPTLSASLHQPTSHRCSIPPPTSTAIVRPPQVHHTSSFPDTSQHTPISKQPLHFTRRAHTQYAHTQYADATNEQLLTVSMTTPPMCRNHPFLPNLLPPHPAHATHLPPEQKTPPPATATMKNYHTVLLLLGIRNATRIAESSASSLLPPPSALGHPA